MTGFGQQVLIEFGSWLSSNSFIIMKTFLTGITSSGVPHLGNYIGAIKPAIEQSQAENSQSLYFIADYHSLVKLQDAALRKQYIYEIAAAWLALGLDPDKTIFYRQSDIPEIAELAWILSTVAGKGLLNRAHAYKDQVAKNIEQELDVDAAITMGLFCYPVLMTADILAFNADVVPVGKDQAQHLEIARDIALRFNHIYGDVFHVPQALIDQSGQTLPGLDGRKMSKSYQNTIPIFMASKQLRKLVMKIKTNGQLPEEPKDPDQCSIFQIYRNIASEQQVEDLRNQYQAGGLGWGEAKQILFECLDHKLTEPRARYDALMSDTAVIDQILAQGAEKARQRSRQVLQQVYQAVGL